MTKKKNVFERKILSKIYGPLYEKGQWWKRRNRELKDLYNEPDVVNVIKFSRFRLAGRDNPDRNHALCSLQCAVFYLHSLFITIFGDTRLLVTCLLNFMVTGIEVRTFNL